MENLQSASTNAPTDSPTAMLFSLPPELLLSIFEFVGVLNFRRDVRRLAVSKKWYPYAISTLFSSLCGNRKYMLPIFGALNKSATLAAAQQLTKHIDLPLDVEKFDPHGPKHWKTRYDVDTLERLALVLEDFTALRTLIVRGGGGCYDQIPSHIIPGIISLGQLTSLNLDILHVEFKGTKHHLCQSISQQIPNLKSLRCRLPHICEKLLDSPPGNIKELIISICSDGGTNLAGCCPGQVPVPRDELKARLKTQLLRFAASMCDPKIVRLIYQARWKHRPQWEAFDAVENRRVLIDLRADWDDGGVPITEEMELRWDSADEISSDDEYDLYALWYLGYLRSNDYYELSYDY
ncbi:hypothetical protein KVR01_004778 [Diaporthe batatas]|uniref:uncharacterized protein n=1 Tax=Diaporthe batatas TaxID=748121 RepID=UPI001D044CF1|nr:uncharacterized protein KVR01_004778 [Diaporthe batatas]KAG8166226.1 hypothetical protein KVR01_004778 [Diaporthe batatas]